MKQLLIVLLAAFILSSCATSKEPNFGCDYEKEWKKYEKYKQRERIRRAAFL